MSFVGPRPIRARFFAELANDLPGLLAAARRAARADRLRAGAARLRDLDGREARPRPRVDRRPVGAALPADALVDRHPRPRPDVRAAAESPAPERTLVARPSRPHRSLDSPRVRDLRDRVVARPGRPQAARCDVGDARPPRPRLPRGPSSRAGSGSPRGGSRSSTSTGGDQPIANEDGIVHRRPERRDLQLRRAEPRRSSAPATGSGRAPTPRRSSTPTRSGSSGSPSGCAGCSRSRSGTRAASGSCSPATGSGSSRSTTATSTASSAFASELDALPKGDLDLDALEAFLATNSVPAPLSIFREIRKLPPGHVLTWEDGQRRARAVRAARAAARARRRRGRAASRSAGRGCATRCVRTSSRTCPVGVLLSGGVDSGTLTALAARGELGAGAHVLDRVRGAVVRRARRRARGLGAVRHAPPRARAAPRRRAAPARRSPTRSTSRSPTPRRCRPTSSRGWPPRT